MKGRGLLLLRMRKLINGSLNLLKRINLKQSEFGFQVKLVKFFLICIARFRRINWLYDVLIMNNNSVEKSWGIYPPTPPSAAAA